MKTSPQSLSEKDPWIKRFNRNPFLHGGWLYCDLSGFRFLARRRFWSDLWRKINQDNCWDLAAQLSFYFLLAFFPFLIFLSALVGFIPFESQILRRLLTELDRFLPEASFELVRDIVLGLVSRDRTRALSIGIVLALWWASTGFSAMVDGLNRSHQVRETRSYVRIKLISILVTVATSLLITVSGLLVFFGDWLVILFELEAYLEFILGPLRGILVFLTVNLGVQIVYHVLPAYKPTWRFISPGSVFATLVWMIGSKAFAVYVNQFFANYQQFYGSLTALVVLMIWFYLSSLSLLIGGEVDSEIHRLRQEERVHPPEM